MIDAINSAKIRNINYTGNSSRKNKKYVNNDVVMPERASKKKKNIAGTLVIMGLVAAFIALKKSKLLTKLVKAIKNKDKKPVSYNQTVEEVKAPSSAKLSKVDVTKYVVPENGMPLAKFKAMGNFKNGKAKLADGTDYSGLIYHINEKDCKTFVMEYKEGKLSSINALEYDKNGNILTTPVMQIKDYDKRTVKMISKTGNMLVSARYGDNIEYIINPNNLKDVLKFRNGKRVKVMAPIKAFYSNDGYVTRVEMGDTVFGFSEADNATVKTSNDAFKSIEFSRGKGSVTYYNYDIDLYGKGFSIHFDKKHKLVFDRPRKISETDKMILNNLYAKTNQYELIARKALSDYAEVNRIYEALNNTQQDNTAWYNRIIKHNVFACFGDKPSSVERDSKFQIISKKIKDFICNLI